MPKTKAMKTTESQVSSKSLPKDLSKIPNKPIIKSFQQINENLGQILLKQKLTKKFSLIDNTGSDLNHFIEDEKIKGELDLKGLAKRFPRALKICKEARFEFPGLPGIKFAPQFEVLARLSTVKSLTLKWNWQRWTCETFLRHICEIIKRLKHLESLDLNLSGFQGLNEKIFKRLVKALKSLICLKRIVLNLRVGSIFKDEWVLCLSEGFRRIKTLEHIDLNFQDCKEIDKGLEHLSKSFSKLSQLQSIKLNFKWCLYLPDIGFKTLGDSLKGLPGLTKIDFDFSGCWQVRDEGLTGLFKGLSGVKSLKEITVRFDRCDYISDKALKAIEKYTQLLPALKKIDLGLIRCRKMTPKGLDDLEESLLRLPGIQSAIISRQKENRFG